LESVLSNTNRAELYHLSWFFAKTNVKCVAPQ